MNKSTLHLLSHFCFVFGFISIIGSIAIWYLLGGSSSIDWANTAAVAQRAYGERFGIFVGLWAPTFFILSDRFFHYAEKSK
jgi:hypothetical protein